MATSGEANETFRGKEAGFLRAFRGNRFVLANICPASFPDLAQSGGSGSVQNPKMGLAVGSSFN